MVEFINDFSILHLLAFLAKWLGQFPFTYNGQKFQLTISPKLIGWTIILIGFHALGLQGLYIRITQEATQEWSSSHTTESALVFLQTTFNIKRYLLFIIWFMSMKRLIICWEKIKLYDSTIGNITIVRSQRRQNWGQLISLLIPWLVALVNIPAQLVAFQVIYPNLQEQMWLHAKLHLDRWASSLIMGTYYFILTISSYIGVSFISVEASLVCSRIQTIIDNITYGCKHTGENRIFTIKIKNELQLQPSKQQQHNTLLEEILNDTIMKLEKLSDIYQTLQMGSKYIIFGCMTFGIVTLALGTFVVLTAPSESGIVAAGVITTILLPAMWKMILLCNAGEYLEVNLAKLKLTIMKILIEDGEADEPGIICVKQQKLSHLKHVISNLDFKLSGCGYFIVNRKTMTSIVSAVLTYNIVLVQFYKSDTEAPELNPSESK